VVYDNSQILNESTNPMSSPKKERLTICLNKADKIQIKTQAVKRGVDASHLIMEWIKPYLEAEAAQSINNNQ
jgi:hypothetical protein